MWRVGFGVAILYAQIATGQVIGGVQLRLGEPRDNVLSSLRQAYSVDSAFTSTDWWTVKEAPKGRIIGTVTFDKTGLAFVAREWLPEDRPSGATVAEAIVNALGRLGGESNCSLANKPQSGPGLSVVGTVVSCGPHSVRIWVARQSEQPSVDVEETWKR